MKLAAGLGGEPGFYVGVKKAERDGALLEDGVMEGADVEVGTEAMLSFRAQLADFELAKL